MSGPRQAAAAAAAALAVARGTAWLRHASKPGAGARSPQAAPFSSSTAPAVADGASETPTGALPPLPPPWLPTAAFAAGLEPYKRVGAVLIREDCCSLAASNPYLNLAEVKIGGVMLRAGGRVPSRSVQLLVRKAVAPEELCGWVVGEGVVPREGRWHGDG
jgi:hypothetical protein